MATTPLADPAAAPKKEGPSADGQLLDVNLNLGRGPLDAERARASFSVTEMATLLAGSPEALHQKKKAVAFATSDPVLSAIQRDMHYLTDRRTIVRRTIERLHHIRKLQHDGQIDAGMANMLMFGIGQDIGGIGLHTGVFLPTIRNMTTPEQRAAWLPQAERWAWIGCYAQTELSHGSNVRGLQTTCTFIPETDEFEVNTPSPGATKWWPGGLGVLSTHCVLYARLLVGGTDHGVHNFLVQIRSLEDHSALPGITIGDIGPKFGTNANDNGFLAFDRARIPRFSLLAKFSHLTREGKYVKPQGSGGAGVYGTMTLVRADIASGAYGPLASAAAIAIRYAAARRQEPGAAEGRERPVLDYTSVQWRLLPQVATAYALRFMGEALRQEIDGLNRRMREDPKLADQAASAMHASTCALKSCCTYLAADGIEECRRALGGHGFSLFSGLPRLYADYFQSFTPEGDNWLLTQQTCSILLRTVDAIDQGADGGAMSPSSAYLSHYQKLLGVQCKAATAEEFAGDLGSLVEALEHRAAWLCQELRGTLRVLTARGADTAEAKRQTLVEQFHVARAHGLAVVLGAFVRGAAEKTSGPPLQLLRRLAALFALVQVQKDRGDFLASGWMAPAQAQLLQPALRALCWELRPEAVALVDAFDVSDFELGSAIGAYDGRYEERLLELAKGEPLNAVWNSGGPAPQEYFASLKPLMDLGRAKL